MWLEEFGRQRVWHPGSGGGLWESQSLLPFTAGHDPKAGPVSGCPSSVTNSPWTNHCPLWAPAGLHPPPVRRESLSAWFSAVSVQVRGGRAGQGPAHINLSFYLFHLLGSCLRFLWTRGFRLQNKEHL